jgi:hypothetical protein
MGLLLTLSGLIVGLYALSSALGLWLAHAVMKSRRESAALPEYLHDMPPHHVNLLADYADGLRGQAWLGSVILLFACLASLAIGSPLSFWALGLTLLIDTWLFLSYPAMRRFIDHSSPLERLLDLAQSGALVAALGVLGWVAARAQG